MPHQPHCALSLTLAASMALPLLAPSTTLSAEEKPATHPKHLDVDDGESIATIRGKARLEAKLARKGSIRLKEIPDGNGRLIEATLTHIEVLAEDFAVHIVGPDGSIESLSREQLPELPLYLHGHVDGDPGSIVFLAVDDVESRGFIENNNGRVLIGDPDWVKAAHQAQIEEDLFAQMEATPTSCGVVMPLELPELPQGGLAAAPACHELPLHLFSDNEHLSVTFNGNTGMWYGWMVDTVAATAVIYRNQVGCRLVGGSLWNWNNRVDPFDQTQATDQLDQFTAMCQNSGWTTEGELYGLISGRTYPDPSGSGLVAGVAELGGLLNGLPFFLVSSTTTTVANSSILNPGSPTLQTIAHEIGHLMGAKHTHDYCPPLDQCAPPDTSGDFDTECQNAQICEVGTLMSYCHMCTGGAANRRFQFHPQIILEMQATLQAAPGISVVQPNPVAVDDVAETDLNEAVDIRVFLNDEPGCKPFSPRSFDAVSANGGSVSFTTLGDLFSEGYFRYTPAPAFIGHDSFTYTLDTDDPSGSTATVTIKVDPHYHATDSILVVDTSDDSVIRVDRDNGFYLGTVVPSGYGGVKDIRSITLSPYGNIVLSSYDTNELLYYHGRTGRFLGVYYSDPGFSGPTDVVFENLTMHASAALSANIRSIHLTQGPQADLTDPEIWYPRDLDLTGRSGEVWVVVDNIEMPVQKWDLTTGTMLSHVRGTADDWPIAVCYYEMPSPGDPTTIVAWYVLVVDRAAWEVRLYDATGQGIFGNILPANVAQAYGLGGFGQIKADNEGRLFLGHDKGIAELDAHNWWTPSIFLKTSSISALGTPGDFTFQEELRPRSGDINFDRAVNGLDLAIMLGEYGTSGAKADLDGDGEVNGRDLAMLLGDWGIVEDDDDQEGDG